METVIVCAELDHLCRTRPSTPWASSSSLIVWHLLWWRKPSTPLSYKVLIPPSAPGRWNRVRCPEDGSVGSGSPGCVLCCVQLMFGLPPYLPGSGSPQVLPALSDLCFAALLQFPLVFPRIFVAQCSQRTVLILYPSSLREIPKVQTPNLRQNRTPLTQLNAPRQSQQAQGPRTARSRPERSGCEKYSK